MREPHDRVAERQLLALVLSGHPGTTQRFLAVPAEAWEHGAHELVATVLRDRITRGVPVDPLMVAAMASDLAGTDHKAEQVRRVVHSAAASTPSMALWDEYAASVVERLQLRRVASAGIRMTQLAENAADLGEVGEIVERMREHVTDLERGMSPVGAEPPMSLQDLLDEQEESYDWLIPDLLERMDRLIWTGFEGTGKSFMLAQFALALAAGVHPFTGRLIHPPGFRVLVLDCENSKRQIRRRYSGIRGRLDQVRETYQVGPVDWSKQLRLQLRPEGIDLTDPREFARVEQAITATAPDVVLGGPLYRLHKQNINDEQAARSLVDALDRLRVKHRFALIVEAHCGHVGEQQTGRKLRPTGSSLFLRWPEFGYGMRAFGDGVGEEHPSTVQVAAWRGSRDERKWPTLLRHGRPERGELPWTPADQSYRREHGMD